MHTHWDKQLKVKELVEGIKPSLVVELGAGGGENTAQYLELRKGQPFKMIVISDGDCPEAFRTTKDFEWRHAISYLELSKFEDGSIDFCSIDTDHNYWTLKQELTLLNKKLKSGGIVVMHDTESYRHSSGSMAGYGTGDPYPPEIKENIGKGMREALEEEVAAGHYKIIRE